MSVRIITGDVREKLRELPDDAFDCVVTSPPYWGLRDYETARWEGGEAHCAHVVAGAERLPWANDVKGPNSQGKNGAAYANMTKTRGGHCSRCGAVRVDPQIGLEPTIAEHLDVLVAVCREVRRVLKPSGVMWLNYGDCYAGSWGAQSRGGPPSERSTLRGNGHVGGGPKIKSLSDVQIAAAPKGTHTGTIRDAGLKPKDLCMIPQRLALALQDDGWWVRSLLPWVKRNGMPESVTDRPANAVEYVIMLTKSARYFYDADAVRRPASPNTNARVAQNVAAQAGSSRANGGAKTNGPMKAVIRRPKRVTEGQGIRANDSFENATCGEVLPDRNFRNNDLFFDSLQPPFGLISSGDVPIALDVCPEGFKEAHFATFPPKLVEPLLRAGCPRGGAVLDPFGGAGTVGLVAERLGMDATLIELNPGYAAIADRRLRAALARVEGECKGDPSDLPLFGSAA